MKPQWGKPNVSDILRSEISELNRGLYAVCDFSFHCYHSMVMLEWEIASHDRVVTEAGIEWDRGPVGATVVLLS